MAIGLHKLTAGSGYTYLTRQVAAHDRDGGAPTPLATYYAERGETPGRWVGRGLSGLSGLTAGDDVTAEQMQNLFGHGLHPLAQAIRERLAGPDLTERDYTAATRLGTPFLVYAPDVPPLQVEVARRLAAADHSQDSGWERRAAAARIRTEVAVERFRSDKGREPANARELSSAIARLSRPRTTAVAGFDMTFSPVKSISALWAVAPKGIAAAIEQAHHDAVADALAYLEGHALFTREGKQGVRQVEVTGLVATAFVHRDSRAGDPDLHTHVAIANKVQTLSGKWLAIDGRLIYKARVAISETYTTSLEANLRTRLGVRFADRPSTDPSKRPIREIVGVSPDLIRRWSTRRASILARTRELEAAFQRDHGRPPTSGEAIGLAQVATLQTRDAKHEPRTLDEQRATWAAQARDALGSDQAVADMVTSTLARTPVATSSVTDEAWVRAIADTTMRALQSTRSTWQVWHVRAEAHRQVRAADAPPDRLEDLVVAVTAQVLDVESIRVTRPDDGITDPATLRRQDGASVYTVAGSAVYTSRDILAAEQRIVTDAAIADRPGATEDAVSLALLEQAANGITLNAAQVALVRAMATSGRRVQLALAPAGSGKTTAMAALASAWSGSGGTVIGFAPSAAAATVLRDHIGTTTDTLAKLTWSIAQDDLPDWAHAIGPSTLAIIDEAGLADTLTLDTAVSFITARGGQVRLIGDQHQLSAIGAGGVLRDIATSHGAVHLTELVRFLDPSEGSASLALREGRPEALGFYFDHQRVHVGGLTTIADDAFTAWAMDRGRGLNSLMVAPTRDLVRDLNRRAQQHRHGDTNPDGGVVLWDGTRAHVGDRVITRRNHRRLLTGPSDWVKNGDQWTVGELHPDQSITVTQPMSGREVRLPADYAAKLVELGYATTIHGAQGLSVDTMHGLVTGTESRQQLYTMLTRGAVANHVYVQTVGDGDPHTLIRPDHTHPPTATDILEQVLRRDGQPVSATTLRREQDDPAPRLADAANRYADALHHAAEQHLGPAALAALDADAESALAGITDDPAWPTLRSHLALLATTGANPAATLRSAIALREIGTADDRAAVIDWRLDDSPLSANAPLPWLPGIPAALTEHPTWGPYLTARAALITSLAAAVAATAAETDQHPTWVTGTRAVPPDVLRDVAVWRAAHSVEDGDRAPTGPKRPHHSEALWQNALLARIGTNLTPAAAEWTLRLHTLVPATIGDPYTPRLAEQLCDVARTGINTHALLHIAIAAPLPDDHPAAALCWRISRHLTPATTSSLEHGTPLSPAWTQDVLHRLGEVRTTLMQASRWWPALVAATDRALAHGIPLPQIVDIAGSQDPTTDIDECQALVWRLSLLTDPIPPDHDDQPEPDGPEEPWIPPTPPTTASDRRLDSSPPDTSADLPALMLARSAMTVLDRSNAEIEHEVARAAAWDDAPFTPQRAAQINAMAADFYVAQLHDSWAADYLCARLHTATPPTEAGHAPAGWTTLTDHLRRSGVTDDELLAVGLATRARTGRFIDRFRDRLTLPITADGQVVGFVARRHPQANDKAGPKYLNTPTTVLFHKGDILYGYDHERITAGATPVLVEGPLDALAVNRAGGHEFIGLAPLGTALTQAQARQLASAHEFPIVATDNDTAGRAAAERAYWPLAQHGTTPRTIHLPEGADPGDLLRMEGPAALMNRLAAPHQLATDLIRGTAHEADRAAAIARATAIVAASPSDTWDDLTCVAAVALDVAPGSLHPSLVAAARRWVRDPGHVCARALERSATSRPSHLLQPERTKAAPPIQRHASHSPRR